MAFSGPPAHILCLGMNHTTAGVALRERLAFSQLNLESNLAKMRDEVIPCSGISEIKELVILSTCNRVELYAAAEKPLFDRLETFLAETRDCPKTDFSDATYRLEDHDAVQHLLKVAAGLDSMVVGEPQILGQVNDAYSTARKQGTTGKILSRLFETAIRTGKRARTETTISKNPASIASIAASLIAEKVPNLISANIMILGAGEMAELAIEALRKRGAQSIFVVNRTFQHAIELAQRWDGKAAGLESMLDHLPDMDIVISSTGAPHIVLQSSMVEQAMRHRSERRLVIMDIAVPRDVDAQVKTIPGVYLYDLDMLTSYLEFNIALREAEVPKVRKIIFEEQTAFEEYLVSLNVVPLICDIHRQADIIRQDELRKTIRRMPGLTPEIEQHLEALTKSIVTKILHSPTTRLRAEASTQNAADYAKVARALFGLE